MVHQAARADNEHSKLEVLSNTREDTKKCSECQWELAIHVSLHTTQESPEYFRFGCAKFRSLMLICSPRSMFWGQLNS